MTAPSWPVDIQAVGLANRERARDRARAQAALDHAAARAARVDTPDWPALAEHGRRFAAAFEAAGVSCVDSVRAVEELAVALAVDEERHGPPATGTQSS